MNNTHSLQILKLLALLANASEVECRAAAERLTCTANDLRRKYSQRSENAETWQPMRSEWERVSVLEGVSELLQAPFDSVKPQLMALAAYVEKNKPDLKVVFFVQEYSLWASLRTVYEYFCTRADCAIRLVYVYSENSEAASVADENIRLFEDAGYSVTRMADYDLSVDSPDVVFYSKPYRGFNGVPAKYYIEEVSRHVRYTVFVSYCLDVQGGAQLVKFFYGLPMFFHAWRVLAYSSYYADRMKRFSYCDAENLIEMGHPKFDGISDVVNSDQYRLLEWDSKIASRPVVLWNTHFSIKDGEGVGTFFQNKDAVLEFFKKHRDRVLLWRPHPYFWRFAERDGRMGVEGLEAFLEELDSMGNVIVDKGGDYRYAFATADALLSDAATFLVEFAMTGKPVMYTPKENAESVINKAYLKEIEVCSGTEALYDFLGRVGDGDEGFERRIRYYSQEFGICDGRNGERLGRYICSEIERDVDELVGELIREKGN